MKIAFASYELVNGASRREGALLQIQFAEGMTGYADCCPWPAWGDKPVEEQLADLACGQLTSLTACSLRWAKFDAEARRDRKSVFESRHLPRSHFLIPDVCVCSPHHIEEKVKQGFSHVKLKVGRQTGREGECLLKLFGGTSCKLRLDFNETQSPTSLKAFLHQIAALKDQIEFIEDPFPYDAMAWKALQQEGWPLACDRQAPLAMHKPDTARFIIIKPAFQPMPEVKMEEQAMIATSYLGHPLEQAVAAYTASQIDPKSRCVHGLASHVVYEPNAFSRQLKWDGPHFYPAKGYGFGFDNELEALDWRPL